MQSGVPSVGPAKRAGRVFIIGPGQHDYSGAAAFGDLVPIMTGRVNPFNVDELLNKLENELITTYKAGPGDFLLLCGNPILNVAVGALFQKHFGQFEVLVYGARNGDYTPRRIHV